MRHAGTGDQRLRFPVYEHLYLLNVYAERMLELLEELSGKFAVCREYMPYRQAMIQYVRASVSEDIVDSINGVELIEAWLHQSQQRTEEEKLRDPDDVYLSVRRCEAKRRRQKLPPLVQFLDEPRAVKSPATKKSKAS